MRVSVISILPAFIAIKLLENDPDLETLIKTLPNGKEIIDVRDQESRRIRDVLNEDCDQAITDAKYGFISGALKETFVDNHLDKEHTTRVIDSIVTHRVWGFPIFFLFMYLMFEGTFVLGEYPMMGIEWLVELSVLIHANMADGPLKDLLVDGIVGGVGGVIVFLPNILILYFCISLMEDSGYMARAAFIMDKIMHKMGLHGKSFIPLIMGFGCNVPAIMASRTIENRKSRLITMLVNQHPPQAKSGKAALFVTQIDKTRLAGEHFARQLTAVFRSHCSFDTLYNGGDRAIVVSELFGAVLHPNAGFFADVFIVGAFIGVLKTSPNESRPALKMASVRFLSSLPTS